MNPGIVSQPVVKLSVTHVEGHASARTALQQTIRETARTGSDIQEEPVGWMQPEIVERAVELLSPA